MFLFTTAEEYKETEFINRKVLEMESSTTFLRKCRNVRFAYDQG